MKQTITAVLAFLILCTACARADDPVADSTDPAGETVIHEEPANPEAAIDSGISGSTAAPPTTVGPIHEVRITGGTDGFRFDPADLTITEGSAIRFIVVEGGPHNVVFDGQNLTSDSQTRLDQQISDRTAPLTSGMLGESGEAVIVSFAGMPAGRYPYFCGTHGASGMRGTITVQ